MPEPINPAVMTAQAAMLGADLRACTPSLLRQMNRVLDTPGLDLETVHLVGSGDSYFAGLCAQQAFDELAGIPVYPSPTFSFLAYHAQGLARRPAALVVCVSASGRSPKVLEALAEARRCGAVTVGITSTVGSPIEQEADHSLIVDLPDLTRGPGVRTFQANVAALLVMAIAIGERRGTLDAAEARRHCTKLVGLADAIDATNEKLPQAVESAAELIAGSQYLLALGSGPSLGIARFAAAKIVEASGVFAAGQEIEEWQHVERFARPADLPIILVAPPGNSRVRALEHASLARSLGRPVVAVVGPGDEGHFDASAMLPVQGQTREAFSPLLYQVFASHLASSLARTLGRLAFELPVRSGSCS